MVLLSFATTRAEATSLTGSGPTAPVSWQVLGPGGGGGVFKPTVSPHDPNLVLAHCDMTGAYISKDGGDNWRMFFTWNVPTAFAFDPRDTNVIYTSTRGFLSSEDRGSGLSLLLRSADRGKSWNIICPSLREAKTDLDCLQSRQLLPSQMVTGGFNGSIERVAVDPRDNRRIYLGLDPLVDYMSRRETPTARTAMLAFSEDGGAHWQKAADLPGMNVLGIFPDSTSGGAAVTVFTEKSGAVVNVQTHKVARLVLPTDSITSAEAGMGKNGRLIYVLSPLNRKKGEVSGGVFVSRDFGRSWAGANTGLFYGVPDGEAPQIRGLAVCEMHPETAYLSSANSRAVRGKDGAWYYGIFKTVDAGKDWKPVWLCDGRSYLTGNHRGSWLDLAWGPGWGGNPIDLGVCPTDPDLVFGGDNGRAYRSRDGGATWNQIHSHQNPDGSVSSTGLDVTTCYGVIFDPFDQNHFFITYTDVGLFHTLDHGKSWFHSIKGVPPAWVNTCYWLTFDPARKGRAWAVWANAHDLPRDKMFGSDGHFTRYAGGVTVTEDGGRTWSVAGQGIPANAVSTCVLVDPDSPVEHRTLYVTVFDQGVYRSRDGGKTWALANNGLAANLYAWRMIRTKEGRLYLLLTRGRADADKTLDGELYRSDDQAQNWTKVTLPEGINAPHDITADPSNGDRMYLACWARSGPTGVDTSGGLLRTENGGKTWKRVFDERIRVNAAAVSPSNPNTIFINTFQNAAFRSDDRGETWKRLAGYRFKWGQRPNINPREPDAIYLSTYGGSVFYGPAQGVPGASEDIVNMPASWW